MEYSTLEGYVGANWSINVAKQALGIGLNKGLDGEFNGIKAVTREEACLYAFRTLQADLVEYNQRVTTNINGTEVTLSSGGAQSRKWTSQQTRIENIREDDIIQFAEEYFRKLEKKTGEDAFKRPAYTWIYDKEEIGTFVDWSLMVEEYTDAVTGRDLYDLIGSAVLKDEKMDLNYYFNGVEPALGCALPDYVLKVSSGTYGDAKNPVKNITKTNGVLQRSNQNDAGFSGQGVLTQVFIDKEVREEIIITSIDTWMGKAGADYSEAKETVPMDVWTEESANTTRNWNIDVDDVPEIVDVKEDQFYLMSISYDGNINGDVIHIWEPEILEESEISKFSTKKDEVPSKVTTGGTEYKKAARGYYDPKALYDYDETLLTDRLYNVILDQYGYMIGIELAEGTKNYVFITGFDRPRSNLSVQLADAVGILLDGTMQTIKVNVSSTDKNIDRARTDSDNALSKQYFLEWQDIVNDTSAANKDYGGFYALNRWFTYSVNEAGVYTLKPATNMVIHNYGATEDVTIKTANLYLDDNVLNDGDKIYKDVDSLGTEPSWTHVYANPDGKVARVYGNDDSVYITVDADKVDTQMSFKGAISDVTGVYTGVQNVEIDIETNGAGVVTDRPVEEAEIFAVYDSDNYIIGAVTNGEGKGNNATIAYVLDTVKSERREGDTYYWEFEAIVGGEIKTLTAKSKFDGIFTDVINDEADTSHKTVAEGASGFTVAEKAANTEKNWNLRDGLVELRFDASEEYVVSAKPVLEKDIYSFYGQKADGVNPKILGNNSFTSSQDDAFANFAPTGGVNATRIEDAKAYRIGGVNAAMLGVGKTWNDNVSGGVRSGAEHHYDSAPTELTLVGRTLYVTPGQMDEGLALASDAKAVVIQQENGKWKTREFSSVKNALSQIVDADYTTSGLQYQGEVVAVMNSNATAAWVVFTSYKNLVSGGNWQPTYGLTRIDFNSMTDDGTWTSLNYDLIGTNAGRNYRVILQTWNDYQGRWDEYASWTVTGTDNTTHDVHVMGHVPTGGRQYRYRLACEDLVSGNSFLL